MLHLLLRKLKPLLLITLALMLIGCASAIQFGFSPPEITFDNSDVEKCRQVEVFADRSIEIILEDRWAETESRNIQDYTLNDNLLSYPNHIYTSGKTRFNVCLPDKNISKYYGLLVLNIGNSSFSGGIWIRINLNDTNMASTKNMGNFLTGNLILSDEKSNKGEINYSTIVFLEMIFIFFDLVVFLAVILAVRKKTGY
jgi:hypothetical protein